MLTDPLNPLLTRLLSVGALCSALLVGGPLAVPLYAGEGIGAGAGQSLGDVGDVDETQAPPLIQMAILLDDSGSMNGLIDQARAHIWDVVYELSRTQRHGQAAQLEVAIFHYGDVPALHKPLLHFSSDLDEVSKTLFAINGGGGSEHCGEVIRNAVQQLSWSDRAGDLKVIYIAGNEPFTQGQVHYQEAISAARERGIVVNTIHCGDRQSGMSGMWAHGAELGGGGYYAINHNRQTFDVAAPQDQEILQINIQLNATYIPYGSDGRRRQAEQVAQDDNAARLGSGAFGNRAGSKASGMYRNTHWDLVDALAEDGELLEELPKEALPEALRDQSREQIEQKIAAAAAERQALQQRLNALVGERQAFIEAERARLAEAGEESTLGQAMVESIRELAKEAGYQREASATAQPEEATP